MSIKSKRNAKTQFTRMCIAEAIIECLRNEEYEKLRVSNIVKKAGVARMTFYKHYTQPYDALIDYLDILIEEYIKECDEKKYLPHMRYEHILHALQFFDKYTDFFFVLNRRNLYGIMIDCVNQFIEKYLVINDKVSVYERYFYAGGLLNTFIRWEENGKKDCAEKVAESLTDFYYSIFQENNDEKGE